MMTFKSLLFSICGAIAVAAMSSFPAFAESNNNFNQQSNGPVSAASYQTQSGQNSAQTYSPSEIINIGHGYFGDMSEGLAAIVEHSFSNAGAPTGYIVGEEASGAFMGGLRYGEGVLHLKNGTRQKVYWQGPSLGVDIGGNGARTMVLVYHLNDPEQLFTRYGSVAGSAYFVAGVGISFQRARQHMLAPIRAGVGARLGANVGYLKYTRTPTWNPF